MEADRIGAVAGALLRVAETQADADRVSIMTVQIGRLHDRARAEMDKVKPYLDR